MNDFPDEFQFIKPNNLKEALKQVYSVINDLQENPAIMFTSQKKKKTKVFAFSIWIKTYHRQYSKFLNKVTYDKIVQKMEFTGYRSIWNHLPAP